MEIYETIMSTAQKWILDLFQSIRHLNKWKAANCTKLYRTVKLILASHGTVETIPASSGTGGTILARSETIGTVIIGSRAAKTWEVLAYN